MSNFVMEHGKGPSRADLQFVTLNTAFPDSISKTWQIPSVSACLTVQKRGGWVRSPSRPTVHWLLGCILVWGGCKIHNPCVEFSCCFSVASHMSFPFLSMECSLRNGRCYEGPFLVHVGDLGLAAAMKLVCANVVWADKKYSSVILCSWHQLCLWRLLNMLKTTIIKFLSKRVCVSES